ncbi:hypothetical protein SUGI_0952180 [Cryptomeria japonica]|nr:hypothetical protein SUGI_0952180 [Cryptomeria japonica]
MCSLVFDILQYSARRRPRMAQMVRALEGDVSLDDLNEGMKPGHSIVYRSYGSTHYDSSQYLLKAFHCFGLFYKIVSRTLQLDV